MGRVSFVIIIIDAKAINNAANENMIIVYANQMLRTITFGCQDFESVDNASYKGPLSWYNTSDHYQY
jgi:site-specific DNA-adenine methylase